MTLRDHKAIKPRTAVLGLVAVVAISIGISTAASSWGNPPEEAQEQDFETQGPYREYELPDVKSDVSAKRYWEETLAALRCIEGQGLRTFGPYPSSDGINIDYAYESSPRSDEVEAACLPTLMSVGMAFATTPPESESRRLLAIRQEIVGCLASKGIDATSESPSSDGPGGTGLGPNPNQNIEYLDADLQLAVEAHPQEARDCAIGVSP